MSFQRLLSFVGRNAGDVAKSVLPGSLLAGGFGMLEGPWRSIDLWPCRRSGCFPMQHMAARALTRNVKDTLDQRGSSRKQQQILEHLLDLLLLQVTCCTVIRHWHHNLNRLRKQVEQSCFSLITWNKDSFYPLALISKWQECLTLKIFNNF